MTYIELGSDPPRRILPEIWQQKYPVPEALPTFPDTCPACGAAATEHGTWRQPVTYACGAAYTSKPQIQNHTDKWWGVCTGVTRVTAVPTTSEYASRPHSCPGTPGPGGHGDLSFGGHAELTFHIIRHHLVRLSMIPSCRRTCPMLTENIKDAAKP